MITTLRLNPIQFDTTAIAVFAGITGLLSFIVGWLVTARLFSLARRTRAAPERLAAIGFGACLTSVVSILAISAIRDPLRTQ